LAEGVSESAANYVFNRGARKVIKDAMNHARRVSISIYYTQVLKRQMKPKLAHGIFLTKQEHLQGPVDWLVKDPEAWDWLCEWWSSEEFKRISEQNAQNRLSKPSIHHYGADGHIRKAQRMVRFSDFRSASFAYNIVYCVI
jgi:hypothetical protein